MLSKGTKKENGIFQVFDMEKFFDKESLLDAMYTLSTRAKVCDKTYRLWYKLNDKARISVKTTVGESDSEVIFDCLGQGMFGAALVSSLNIGCGVQDAFRGRPMSRIGF